MELELLSFLHFLLIAIKTLYVPKVRVKPFGTPRIYKGKKLIDSVLNNYSNQIHFVSSIWQIQRDNQF